MDEFFDVIDDEEEDGYLETFDEEVESTEHLIESNEHLVESTEHLVESTEHLVESNEHLVEHELESRRIKLQLAEAKQLAKLQQIEIKKRKQFEKKILSIIENLDISFTFKELNSFERMVIHEMADKHKLYHHTVNGKLTISKSAFDFESEVSQMMEKVQITEKRYNLRSRSQK